MNQPLLSRQKENDLIENRKLMMVVLSRNAKYWLKEKGLTPHPKSSIEIELIPTDLHANIPHIGSAQI